ncbi:hypothetical protein [Salinigranum rubrum]|uniref:hypothetical protein n=1 Tax=Salinigranum rubrum TaxID=755307 RepID=UPI0013A532BB|nr:hypothetical protein [Salinigranum rubrum]
MSEEYRTLDSSRRGSVLRDGRGSVLRDGRGSVLRDGRGPSAEAGTANARTSRREPLQPLALDEVGRGRHDLSTVFGRAVPRVGERRAGRPQVGEVRLDLRSPRTRYVCSPSARRTYFQSGPRTTRSGPASRAVTYGSVWSRGSNSAEVAASTSRSGSEQSEKGSETLSRPAFARTSGTRSVFSWAFP